MSKIKSFRGKLADGGQERIHLATNNGSTGYRIKKLTIFPNKPGHTTSAESVVQIFSIQQTTVLTTAATVDFSDQTLLGVAYYQDHVDSAYPGSIDIVFDNMTFNQDIYITHNEISASGSSGTAGNYYIELEQLNLDLTENTVATLKDIRNIEASNDSV